MAEQSIRESRPQAQAVGPLDDSRRIAAATLASSALSLLGCNAAEIYVFVEDSDSFVSLSCTSDGDPLPSGAPIAADEADAFFGEHSDVAAIDNVKSLGGPFSGIADRLYAASVLLLRVGA